MYRICNRKLLALVGVSLLCLSVTRVAVSADHGGTDRNEIGSILQRLERLEHENEELILQNQYLYQTLHTQGREIGTFQPASHSVTNHLGCTSCDDECGSGCCSSCKFFSCQCPQQPAPCLECPHVSTLQPFWNVNIFGALVTDAIYSTKRPLGPGTPFLLAPGSPFGFKTDTFDMHARQTSLGAVLVGPRINGWQAGGTVLVNLYDIGVVNDKYGLLPLQAFGELKNDQWRLAAGLQFDVFNPNAATILPFSILSASGNSGNNFRGQIRLERFIPTSACTQWTLQFAISEPVATAISSDLSILEDNGWPNVEGRAVYGVGTPELVAGAPRRPLEVGVSGVVGQLRRTQGATRVVSDVWAIGTDYRWKLSDRFGFQGELFHGQGLGTYNAGILRSLNAETFEAVRTTGGWVEMWYYWTPCLHSHIGYGIDDPVDSDLATVMATNFAPIRNETWFANWLWDITPSFRLGFEFTWRETNYDKVPDAEGAGLHTQLRWNF